RSGRRADSVGCVKRSADAPRPRLQGVKGASALRLTHPTNTTNSYNASSLACWTDGARCRPRGARPAAAGQSARALAAVHVSRTAYGDAVPHHDVRAG